MSSYVVCVQLQRDALQAAVDKEKQTGEITESQLQSIIDTLQVSADGEWGGSRRQTWFQRTAPLSY